VPLEAREVREVRRNSYVVLKENERSGLQDDKGRPVDLKRDVLSSGKLRVETACLSGGQFLGMARPDLFVRLPDNSFLMSYIKSMCSIGLMMVMIVVLGVVSGCFLKGPVATLLAAFIVLVGWGAHSFLEEVTSGRMSYNQEFKLEGRGLIDGLIRIPTHKTPSVELEDTTINRIVKAVDSVELNGLWALKHIFPDFGPFDTTEYVANAFDVPWREALLPNLAVTIGFCLPWIIVGYFSLKVRELEAK
jgi:hypothetical protein